MASIYIEQDSEGLLVVVTVARATDLRRCLVEACIRFRERPSTGDEVAFHIDEDTPRSTLYRALEPLL